MTVADEIARGRHLLDAEYPAPTSVMRAVPGSIAAQIADPGTSSKMLMPEPSRVIQ
jgi:hypothetical protein